MHGIVLYTDGGSRPNNGFGGSGIHGYTWDSDITYRGVGLTTHVLTPTGYQHKAEAPAAFSQELKAKPVLSELGVAEFMDKFHKHRVTPVSFFDTAHPLEFGTSNNVAEMMAMVCGLRSAVEYHKTQRKLDCIYVRYDSKYVGESVMDNMETWAANDWTLSSGEPTKNISEVIQLMTVVREIEALGIYLGRKYVPGHGDCPGNDTADRFATAAVFMSKANNLNPYSVTSATEQYWKSASEQRHPLLTHRFLYFDNHATTRERGVYYVGNQGREIDLLGKRESDGAYGVVRLKDTLVGELETIVDKQHSLPIAVEAVVMMDLDVVYGDHYRYLNTLGGLYLRQINDYRNDLVTQNKILITREYSPAMLANRVYDNVFKLESILGSYQNNPESLQITDITSTFFDIEEVKPKSKKGDNPHDIHKNPVGLGSVGYFVVLGEDGKPVPVTEAVVGVSYKYVIKDDVIVGVSFIDVVGKFFGEDQQPIEEVVRLSMGIDMPVRNAIRKLADLNPKISLVTWRIGVDFHNYAIVIDCDDAISIYAGMASNLRVTGTTANEQEIQRQRIIADRDKRLAKKAPKKE